MTVTISRWGSIFAVRSPLGGPSFQVFHTIYSQKCHVVLLFRNLGNYVHVDSITFKMPSFFSHRRSRGQWRQIYLGKKTEAVRTERCEGCSCEHRGIPGVWCRSNTCGWGVLLQVRVQQGTVFGLSEITVTIWKSIILFQSAELVVLWPRQLKSF